MLGLGLPEVVHATLGYHPVPGYSVDLRLGALVYSPLVGLGVSTYLNRSPDPAGGSTSYLSADVRYNPDFSATSTVEQVEWATTVSGGFRTNRFRGFFFDARLTGWLYSAGRDIGASVSFAAGLGWAF